MKCADHVHNGRVQWPGNSESPRLAPETPVGRAQLQQLRKAELSSDNCGGPCAAPTTPEDRISGLTTPKGCVQLLQLRKAACSSDNYQRPRSATRTPIGHCYSSSGRPRCIRTDPHVIHLKEPSDEEQLLYSISQTDWSTALRRPAKKNYRAGSAMEKAWRDRQVAIAAKHGEKHRTVDGDILNDPP